MVVNIIRYSFWTGHHVWLLPYNNFCFELLVPINQVFIKFSKQMIHNLPFMSSSHVRCFFVEFRLSFLKKNSLTTFHWSGTQKIASQAKVFCSIPKWENVNLVHLSCDKYVYQDYGFLMWPEERWFIVIFLWPQKITLQTKLNHERSVIYK